MKEKVLAFLARIHACIRFFAVGIVLKRILVPVMLVSVYLLPLGLTSIITRIFRPKLLQNPPSLPGSHWRAASAVYEPLEEKCLRQS